MNIKALIEELYRKHSIKPLLTISNITRLEPLSQVLKSNTPYQKVPFKEFSFNKRNTSMGKPPDQIQQLDANINAFPIRDSLPHIKSKKQAKHEETPNDIGCILPISLFKSKCYSKRTSEELSIKHDIDDTHACNNNIICETAKCMDTNLTAKLPSIHRNNEILVNKRPNKTHLNTKTHDKEENTSKLSISIDDLTPW